MCPQVQTKHIAQMLYPYACSVKYLDAVSAVVLVRPESSTAAVTSADALAHIDKHNTKDLAVVTLIYICVYVYYILSIKCI